MVTKQIILKSPIIRILAFFVGFSFLLLKIIFFSEKTENMEDGPITITEKVRF